MLHKILSLHMKANQEPMAKKPFTPIPPMAELPPAEDIDIKALLDKYLSGEIDLICVLGPTASGKTRYAVQLARQINALLNERGRFSNDGAASEKRATPLAAGGRSIQKGASGVLPAPSPKGPVRCGDHFSGFEAGI